MNIFISLLTMEDVEALTPLAQHSMSWLKIHPNTQRVTEYGIAVSALVLQLVSLSHFLLVCAARLVCLGRRGINADTELTRILFFLSLLQSFLPHTHKDTRG